MPGVSGIKFASTDRFRFTVLHNRCPENQFFFGFDKVCIIGAALRADGGIGMTCDNLGKLFLARRGIRRRSPWPSRSDARDHRESR